jgi:hypothetical protein
MKLLQRLVYRVERSSAPSLAETSGERKSAVAQSFLRVTLRRSAERVGQMPQVPKTTAETIKIKYLFNLTNNQLAKINFNLVCA